MCDLLHKLNIDEGKKNKLTSIASWSFSISSPFFLWVWGPFLVLTTVTTLVTVIAPFCWEMKNVFSPARVDRVLPTTVTEQ